MKWIIAILIFSLLIIVHEYGHFLVARLNGVDVEEFSIGFGPRLLSTVSGGVRYSLKALPFGGSCRMRSALEEMEGDMSLPDSIPEGTFESVSYGRRAAILFAGPFFNFLLAFVCAIIVIGVVGYDPAEVLAVAENSPAAEAGLKKGDVITGFMGGHVDIGRDVDTWFVLHDLTKETTVTMTVRRNGETKKLSFRPLVTDRYMLGMTYMPDENAAVIEAVQASSPLAKAGIKANDIITAINGNAMKSGNELASYMKEHPLTEDPVTLTIKRGEEAFATEVTPVLNESVTLGASVNLGRVRTTPIRVVGYSFVEIRYWIGTVLKSLGGMFTGRFTVNDLSGPVGVVDVVGTTYENTKSEGALMTWMNMLNLIILLSANLGVMNLLPIPGIDGGRLLGILISVIRGRPMDVKVEGTIQLVTATLLLALMVYVCYHDIITMLAR
ncbi:MAG: RIP metalloprotease RseP [Lachnospiraceae bacterium]|nr:RIP metalloprotease RseP [Lachnospiraceae bacterium]